MLVAAIGNIRGNIPALSAVLDEIDREGIQTIINTGDSVGWYPWPNEVLDALASFGVVSVQGTLDRMVVRFLRKTKTFRKKLRPEVFDALLWTYEHMASHNLELLGELPKSHELHLEDLWLQVCHGTLTSQTNALTAEDDDERFLRQREILPAHIFFLGGSDEPHHRLASDALFVCPGSVGGTADTLGTAHYCVVDTDQKPWRVDSRSVAYDRAEIDRTIAECGLSRKAFS